MTSSPTDSLGLPTQHFRMALRMIEASPELVGRLVKNTGMTPADIRDPGFVFPVSAFWPLCDNAADEFGEQWFLGLPILWSVDVHSEFGMAVRFAPSYSAALDLMSEFGHVRWPVLRALRSQGKSGQTLTIVPIVRVTPRNWRFMVSITSLSFQTVAKSILSHGAETIQYQFEGQPPRYAEELALLFDGNVSWGHDRTTIFVPAALLDQVSPLANANSFAAMLASLRALAAEQPHLNSFAVRVSQALDGVTSGRIDAGEMARRIGVSRRTFERRLESEGTSFRELLNASSKERLETLLRDPSLTTDMVAERLGFHDASSLLRACRRWFGKTPAELKRALRAPVR